VLRFANAAALANGGAAAGVVGQAGFTTGSSGLSAQRIALFHSHISTDATGNLFVADTLNNRALRFATVIPTPPAPPTARPVVRISGAKQVTTSKEFYTVRGTAKAQGGLLRVSYNQNDQGFLLARGKAKWTARLELVRGRNRVVFYAVNREGKLSKPQTIIIFRR
jgi:hypothetical protein